MWLRSPECDLTVDAFTKGFNLKSEFGMRTYGRLIRDATFLSVGKRNRLEAYFKEVRKSDNSFQADFTLYPDSAVEDEDEDEDEGENKGEDEDKKERGNAEEIKKADCTDDDEDYTKDDDWGDREATEPFKYLVKWLYRLQVFAHIYLLSFVLCSLVQDATLVADL
jgi:hypothetical protein